MRLSKVRSLTFLRSSARRTYTEYVRIQNGQRKSVHLFHDILCQKAKFEQVLSKFATLLIIEHYRNQSAIQEHSTIYTSMNLSSSCSQPIRRPSSSRPSVRQQRPLHVYYHGVPSYLVQLPPLMPTNTSDHVCNQTLHVL